VIPNEESALPLALPSPERPPSSARTLLVASAAATLLLYSVPFFGHVLARPLLLLSTLAHEMGHGLTAVFLGGSFQRLAMWANGSGLAEIDIAGFGRVSEGLTLAGGRVGPSVAAAICFFLGRTGRGARACLWGLAALLLLAEILLVRNLFGFVGLLAAACFLAASRLSLAGAQLAVVFAGVQLALAVFSRADCLFARAAINPSGAFPSDVVQMQRVLLLPYWFWGAACGAFSVAVLLAGLRIYWRR